jgi:hypothetical protein
MKGPDDNKEIFEKKKILAVPNTTDLVLKIETRMN